MSRWTNARSLRACKPVARVAGSRPEEIALLVRRRIHSSSIQSCYLVAVSDGNVYATPSDGLAAQGIAVSQIVGTYTRRAKDCDIAEDIRHFLETAANEATA